MTPDLSEEEEIALVDLPKRTVEADHYPLSPRILTLGAILAKLDPPAAFITEPLPRAKLGDQPRATLGPMKRRPRDSGGTVPLPPPHPQRLAERRGKLCRRDFGI
jgi:hypothetical protein